MKGSATTRALTSMALMVALGAALTGQRLLREGSQTASETAAGKAMYERSCAACHNADLRGGQGPELAGPNFRATWEGRTTSELLDKIKRTMPPGNGGALGDDAYVKVVAYILQVNGYPLGQGLRSADLLGALAGSSSDAHVAAGQTRASLSAGPPSESEPSAAPSFSREVTHPVNPVTDELLRYPPPHDWLNWRRTLDGQAYSPLAQISRANITTVRAAWVWAMTEGGVETTPLVHDGVMYLANSGDVIQALNAQTGDLLWEYRHRGSTSETTGAAASKTRTLALYGGNVFTTTSNGQVVALDARTGQLVWQTQKVDPNLGFAQQAGPTLAGGVLISGLDGCGRFRREGCFITGHDPQTGKELWRTSTIARPGDPNDATWGKVPPALRAGGETWIPGTYDPDLGLLYIGTAQAKPWNAVSRGMTTDDAALYTNSTLALDPRTGKIVWYFQHVPGESVDHDTVFERVLVDVGNQRLLFTVGKDGLMWKLDRRNGAFLGVKETMFQNVYEAIDTRTGSIRYRRDIREAQIGQWILVCPGYYGGHNWIASAYNPPTNALIVPLNQHCEEMRPRKVELVEGSGGNGADVRLSDMPGSGGRLGKLSAFDVRTMAQLWTHEQTAPFTTAALATAGGLVFVGDVDRYFHAFDANTGAELWRFRLGAAALGYPITYAVDGKQFVAVPTGLGGLSGIRVMAKPPIHAPSTGSALYVFELPGNGANSSTRAEGRPGEAR